MATSILGLGAALTLASLPATQLASNVAGPGRTQQNATTAPPGGLTQTNLGLAVGTLVARGRWAAFTVVETAQGGVDLNGDGDALDHVLHVLDLNTGVIKNTRLVAQHVTLLKDVVTFGIRETGSDLNGDGDTSDTVAHVLRLTTNEVVNLGLARSQILSADGHWSTFRVSEASQGRDLNGDGDLTDSHLHVHDVRTNTVKNLAITPRGGSHTVEQSGSLAAFLVSELSAEAPDLNGDGDEVDDVLFVHDFLNDATINLGLAAEPSPINLNRRFGVDRGVVAMSVLESAQGATDLNGDGDAADIVLHAFAVRTGQVYNTGLAPIRTPLDQDATTTFILANTRLAFMVDESAQGATDLDGNGSATEAVPHVYDLRTQQAANVGIAGRVNSSVLGSQIGFDGRFLAFMRTHATLGGTLQVYDALNNTTLDTQLLEGLRVQVEGGLVAQLTPETVADLNADGDQDDLVQTVVDGATGATLFTVASGTAMTLAPPRGYAAALEHREGATDLNGDGDVLDAVIITHDLSAGTVTNTGLAEPANPARVVIAGRNLLIPVTETFQGVDLNGDGDVSALDTVLHRVQLAP